MGLSKIVDPVLNKEFPDTETGCRLGRMDCQYLDSNGDCSAEWCIYEELPKIIKTDKKVTCSICGKNTKIISLYSGITEYTCPECRTKIKKITKDEKLCSVCNENKIAVDQYICTSCQKKLITYVNHNQKCSICGTSTSVGVSVCSSCSSKIREKLNEPND